MIRTLAALGMALLLPALWAQDTIRLKNRVFRPETNLRPEWRPGATHYILRFQRFPDSSVLAELARRQIRVIGYVPDSALMVVSEHPLALDGLDVTWTGRLEATDKISSTVMAVPSGAYLVIFQPDADMGAQRIWIQSLGLTILENSYLLPGQLIVIGGVDPSTLAQSDAVAYILPASEDLVAGNPVMGCAGPLTEAGPVAEYATVGTGWPKDSTGNSALQYFFQSLTDKVDAATVEGEIERAFREWQKYANFTLSPGVQATAVRTIAIQFARGMHGDAYPFDGKGGVLAHTFYPVPANSESVAGDMHFDADEDWHAGSNTDIFSVALHETGHALGLGHSSSPGAVMYPYYHFASGLTDDDIAGIRALYGSSGAQTPATPVQPPVVPPVQPPVNPPVQPPSQPPVTDNTAPSLTIVSPGSTITSTAAASIHLIGTANDNVGVTAVKWSTSNGDSGSASGTTAWSANVPLLIGSTVVTVRAYDAAGNSGWRTVTVVRR